MRITTRMAFALALLAMTLASTTSLANELVVGEKKSFLLTPKGRFSSKPIEIFYYKPHNATPESRVLIALHGVDRSGSRARDNWASAADKYGLIILAPELDETNYPEKYFQFGGIESKNHDDWSFNIIEDVFEKVRIDENLKTNTYFLFGHSAGAQFTHRFALMTENARSAVVVAANAGTYTMPEYSASFFAPGFPWALSETYVPQEKLKEAFKRTLIVLLGEKDIKSDGSGVPRSQQALAQGANRLERGKRFCAAATSQAEKLRTTLSWKCVRVPNVGHDSARMSKAAEKLLFE